MICPVCENVHEVHIHKTSLISVMLAVSLMVAFGTCFCAFLFYQQDKWLEFYDIQTCEQLFKHRAEKVINERLNEISK